MQACGETKFLAGLREFYQYILFANIASIDWLTDAGLFNIVFTGLIFFNKCAESLFCFCLSEKRKSMAAAPIITKAIGFILVGISC